jgi:alanine racemase
MTAAPDVPRAEIVVDVGAIGRNVRRLSELMSTDLPAGVGAPAIMVVVKADGYGHGMVESARAARAGGATWIAGVTVQEALVLRSAE